MTAPPARAQQSPPRSAPWVASRKIATERSKNVCQDASTIIIDEKKISNDICSAAARTDDGRATEDGTHEALRWDVLPLGAPQLAASAAAAARARAAAAAAAASQHGEEL